MIKLKRAYDPVSKTDGRRFLVERACGLTKAKLRVDGWLKEVGPSTPCASGSATIRINRTRSARATPANSARGRRPGNP